MPQIPLVYGQMDLESDQSSRKDSVLAMLYNGFRVGQSLHMWPSLSPVCDLGTNAPVYSWYSVLHQTHLAVSNGKLYKIADGAATMLGHTTLTAGIPPTFTEDAKRIFIAAGSTINFYTPGDTRVYVPRHNEIGPVVSDALPISTIAAGLSFTYQGIANTTVEGGTIKYATADVNGAHYRAAKIVNGVETELAADESPGGPYSFTLSGLGKGDYTVTVKLTGIEDPTIEIFSAPMVLKVRPDVVGVVGGIFVITEHANNAPHFTVGPTASVVTQNSAVISYDSTDAEGDHYRLVMSKDNGKTWEELSADEAGGEGKTHSINGLTSSTYYRFLLRMIALTGNNTEITSEELVFTTTSADTTANDPDSPLTFSRQPTVSASSDTSLTVVYGTADANGNHYKMEYSLNNGATWVESRSIESAGQGKTLDVSGLEPDTAYVLRLRLTSRPSQCPDNVTSLAFVSGFLVANGDDPMSGGLPGDFAFSDTQGDDGPSYDVWSYENNATSPDALQTIVALADETLYAIGSQSVDVSYISGNVDNPFASNKGAAQPFGTPARYSVAYDGQSIYFLTIVAGSRQIVRLIGGREPQVIGFPVGVPIQDIADVSDVRSVVLAYRGQPFFLISFPSAEVVIDDVRHEGLTLAFNVRAQEWFFVGTYDTGKGHYKGATLNTFAYDQTIGYIGGSDGKIYTFDTETRGTEPVMMHRWRNNGEMEWREPRIVSLGKMGERQLPVKQRQCGRYTRRQDEITFANGPSHMVIRTGWRTWGKEVEKISHEYLYDVKRGDKGIVFNGCEEVFEVYQ